MGTYLYFKLKTDTEANAKQANKFLDTLPEQETLEELGEYTTKVHFHEEDYYPGLAAGSLKTGNIRPENKDQAMELYTSIFDSLHDNNEFTIKILAHSCSLSLYSFDPDQLLKITNNGQALSGEKKMVYKDMLTKYHEIGEFPSNFVSTLHSQENLTHLTGTTSRGQNQLKEEIEVPTDISSDDIHALQTLLTKDKLRILDILLTFSQDKAPISTIAEQTPFTEDDIKTKIKNIEPVTINPYGQAYINSDHKLTPYLQQIHDRTYQDHHIGT